MAGAPGAALRIINFSEKAKRQIGCLCGKLRPCIWAIRMGLQTNNQACELALQRLLIGEGVQLSELTQFTLELIFSARVLADSQLE